jgi:predicted metal-dependent hydrolase
MTKYLEAVMRDFEEFKNLSLKGSQDASRREAMTFHKHEYLIDGKKATFCIENYLGGTYYLTSDEILNIEDRYIIQESKNSTKKALPELSDIQDGLFKLILYSNIDSLQLNGQQVLFSTKLKLTGKGIRERVILPCSLETLEEFLEKNSKVLRDKDRSIVKKLLLEVQRN